MENTNLPCDAGNFTSFTQTASNSIKYKAKKVCPQARICRGCTCRRMKLNLSLKTKLWAYIEKNKWQRIFFSIHVLFGLLARIFFVFRQYVMGIILNYLASSTAMFVSTPVIANFTVTIYPSKVPLPNLAALSTLKMWVMKSAEPGSDSKHSRLANESRSKRGLWCFSSKWIPHWWLRLSLQLIQRQNLRFLCVMELRLVSHQQFSWFGDAMQFPKGPPLMWKRSGGFLS